MGKPPIRGHFSRSRDLNTFNRKFYPLIIEQKIPENGNVLEIGCGEGRVLLELLKKCPSAYFYGINKKPWPAMRGTVSLKKTAIFYEIFKKSEISSLNLPKIHFYNAKKLHFENSFFDVIYSQVAIQYVDRKDLLIEEVWRVLKPGGVAYLNIDTRSGEIPDFLDFEAPRFIIYKNTKVFSLKKFFGNLKKKGFDIQYTSVVEDERGILKSRINLIIKKNTNKKLQLGLKFNKLSSFELSLLNKGKDPNSILWGYRSVYSLT